MDKLPMPNEKEVLEFKLLCEKKFSVKLSQEEAIDWATRLLHIFYLTSHEIYSLRQEEQ
jgi:hypothetical protein